MSKKEPLVSIVIPTFNHCQYIERSILSVLNQSYKNIELIIVNDGSTDNTRELLGRLYTLYSSRIQIIHQQNMGQAIALNRGWTLSKGEYLAYLSSDDILYPDAVSTIIAYLESNPSTIAAYPNSDLIDQNDRLIKPSVCRQFELTNCIISQTCNIGPGAIFRREAFEHIGGWNAKLKLGPDRLFWISASQLGAIGFINQVHAGYRFHTEAISYKEQSEYVSREYLRVTRQIFNEYTNLNLEDAVHGRHKAMANAYMIVARNRLRELDLNKAAIYYKIACKYDRNFRTLNTKIQLIKFASSKYIRRIFANSILRRIHWIKNKFL